MNFARPRLILVVLALVLSVGLVADGAEGDWREDFDAAQREALAQGRPMLIFFTGSDWCIWCQRLEKEVFDTASFERFAGEKLVLSRIDFPRRRKLPPARARRNGDLKAAFEIEAFPAVLLYSPERGAALLRHGYLQIEPDDYVQALKARLADLP